MWEKANDEKAFNSLFEMPSLAAVMAPDAETKLSILYLRCMTLLYAVEEFGEWRTFNSLFEMRQTLGSNPWRLGILSILYLRCRHISSPSSRLQIRPFLSILYLRCADEAVVMLEAWLRPFNSLFEMHGRRRGGRLQRRRSLSILYLRCVNSSGVIGTVLLSFFQFSI